MDLGNTFIESYALIQCHTSRGTYRSFDDVLMWGVPQRLGSGWSSSDDVCG